MTRPFATLSLCLTLIATHAALAADESVDNPSYVSWAKLGKGSSVTHAVVTQTSGQTINTETTQTLVEVTPELATVEMKNKVEMMGTTRELPPQKVTFKAKVSKQQAEGQGIPQGSSAKAEPAGEEKLKVAGKEFTCKVMNFTGDTNGMKSSGKMWRSEEVPGGLVRMHMDVEGAHAMSLKMELKTLNLK
jgi:hypothetical protein